MRQCALTIEMINEVWFGWKRLCINSQSVTQSVSQSARYIGIELLGQLKTKTDSPLRGTVVGVVVELIAVLCQPIELGLCEMESVTSH